MSYYTADTLRERMPIYVILSFLFSVAVWSLWVPSFFGGAGVDEVEAVSFGTPTNLATIESDSKLQMVYYNNAYYLAFTALSGSNIIINVASSTDGTTWSAPVTAYTGVRNSNGTNYVMGFAASPYTSGEMAITVQATSSGFLYITKSSNYGATWAAATVLSAPGSGTPDARAPIAYSSGVDVMGALYEAEGLMIFATSSDGATWASSTIDDISFAAGQNGYEATPLGVHISADGQTIQAVYDTATSTVGYTLVYASSTDGGATWATSSAVGDIPVPTGGAGAGLYGMSEMSSVSFDDNGQPGIVYMVADNLTGEMVITYDVMYAKRSSSGTWSTSTVASNISYSLAAFPEPSYLSFYDTDAPLIGYINSSNYPYFWVNTSTPVAVEISTDAVGLGTELTLAYNTTDYEVGYAYVSGGVLYFTTSSLYGVPLSAPTIASISSGTTTSTLTWSDVTSAAHYSVSSTAASTATTTATTTDFSSLTPNTLYSYQVATVDGPGQTGDYSTATSSYTNPTAVTSVTAAATSDTAVTVSWSSTNGSGSVYDVYNDTTSALVATTTATSYSVTGLTAETAYVFKVRVQYLSDSASYTDYASASSVTTDAAPVASSGGGSPAPTISLPAVSTESIVPVVAPTSGETVTAPVVTARMGSGESFNFSAGGSTHSFSVNNVTNAQVSMTLRSDPITFDLAKGEERVVDLNNDGVGDVHVVLNDIVGSTADVAVTVLDELPVIVDNNMSVTNDRNITIRVGSIKNVTHIAVSEDATFTNVSFVSYPDKGISYTVSPSNGNKKLYIKVKTSAGASATIEDSIRLVGEGNDAVCDITPGSAYKSSASNAVYYITEDCQRRAFTNSDRYFSYFTSWNAVKTVAKSILESIEIDPRGIMPWGPLYDPQYGALVKTLDDPKVYLLLNTEKYWITSEDVFNNLNYQWDWIEDVSEELLSNYTNGSEITYTDHHPNYTLVKYKHDPKVYRLEPSSTDTTKQVKRHVANETSFEQLKFRWDRIVTIPDTEVYEDGVVLK